MKIRLLLIIQLMMITSHCSHFQTETEQEVLKSKSKTSTKMKRKLKKKEKELAPCICMEIYAPVCGKDGVTYSNECMANCSNIRFEKGECPYK